MNPRKSITAVAAAALVLSLGTASTSSAATSSPTPKPAISGGTAGADGTSGHEKAEGTKVQSAENAKKGASAALTTWRRGKLAAKRAEVAEIAAARAVYKADKVAADKSATKVADLAAAKTKFDAAKAAAKTKFDAAIAALGPKPTK